MLNINGNTSDLHYRYKMPPICIKIEGKGNGVKTLISNITTISKSLNRPVVYIIKYAGYELCAQTQCDLKKQKFIINGSYEVQKLQAIVDAFINKYVLCSECGNPETDLIVQKSAVLQLCKACGFRKVLEPCKMTNFIIKHTTHSPMSASRSDGLLVARKKTTSRIKASEFS